MGYAGNQIDVTAWEGLVAVCAKEGQHGIHKALKQLEYEGKDVRMVVSIDCS